MAWWSPPERTSSNVSSASSSKPSAKTKRRSSWPALHGRTAKRSEERSERSWSHDPSLGKKGAKWQSFVGSLMEQILNWKVFPHFLWPGQFPMLHPCCKQAKGCLWQWWNNSIVNFTCLFESKWQIENAQHLFGCQTWYLNTLFKV